MKDVDYIVVGLGIAGITFCEQLERHGKSYVVFDSGSHTATAVAGGVINPVVLKWFTPAWDAANFLASATQFYKSLSDRLGTPCYIEIPIHRVLANPQEQNDWLLASDTERLSSFLASEIVQKENDSVIAPFGYGAVLKSLQVNTGRLIPLMKKHLSESGKLQIGTFEHDLVRLEEEIVLYKEFSAQHIVFAEGAQAVHNPYFTIQSLLPKKGEYIIVKAPKLNVKTVVKASIFIIPLGNDLYKVGATFAHGDMSFDTTEKGRTQLVTALENIVNVPFEVVDQIVGMRPTVSDRRPLLGSIEDVRIQFFNGLGTRGLLMAPLLSEQLFKSIEFGESLSSEISITRFF